MYTQIGQIGSYMIIQSVKGDAYTQYNYGYGKRNADYDAIRNVFLNLNNAYKDQGLIFGIPSVGAGLAGGDWKQIEKIINESTPDIKIIHFYL